MENLQKLLNAKLQRTRDLLGEEVSITLKADGNAFQAWNDGESISFMKRSQNPYKSQGKNKLNAFDFLFSDNYWKAYKHLNTSKCLDILKQYNIVNFEALGSDSHVSKQNSKKDLVLLSAVNLDGTIADYEEIARLSGELDVDVIQRMFFGVLSSNFIKALEMHKDDNQAIYDDFTSLLKHDNLDIDFSKIEGFVLSFSKQDRAIRNYKVVNPKFKERLDARLQEEKDTKSIVTDDLVAKWMPLIERNLPNHYAKLDRDDDWFCRLFNSITSNLNITSNMELIQETHERIFMIKHNQLNDDFLRSYDWILIRRDFNSIEEDILFWLMIMLKQPRNNGFWVSSEFQNNVLNPFLTRLGVETQF